MKFSLSSNRSISLPLAPYLFYNLTFILNFTSTLYPFLVFLFLLLLSNRHFTDVFPPPTLRRAWLPHEVRSAQLCIWWVKEPCDRLKISHIETIALITIVPPISHQILSRLPATPLNFRLLWCFLESMLLSAQCKLRTWQIRAVMI